MNYTPAPARGDCPTGKVQFATRKQARRGAKFRAERMATYRCDACGWWHLGHLPQRVRNGEIDKAAWLASKPQQGRGGSFRSQVDPSYTDVIPGRNGTIQWGNQ